MGFDVSEVCVLPDAPKTDRVPNNRFGFMTVTLLPPSIWIGPWLARMVTVPLPGLRPM